MVHRRDTVVEDRIPGSSDTLTIQAASTLISFTHNASMYARLRGKVPYMEIASSDAEAYPAARLSTFGAASWETSAADDASSPYRTCHYGPSSIVRH